MNTLGHNIHNSKGTVVWGIRLDPLWKKRWQHLALIMGVPVGRLVNSALIQWVENNKGVLRDGAARRKLGEIMEQQDWELPPSAKLDTPIEEEDAILERKRVNLSIRGVKAITQLRLKAISIGTKQPIYNLIDAMVARAWNEIADRPVPEETDRRLSKAARQFFKKMIH